MLDVPHHCPLQAASVRGGGEGGGGGWRQGT